MTDPHAEIERLRAQVADLERQLAEQAARTNAAVAAAQERAYWLDRWHLDLNALMATRRGAQIRALMRAVRAPVRRVRLIKRRLLG
jgi:cell division septum initiation protein DivIVA